MGFFLDYLQKQKSIYAEGSTVYNVHQSKNGGFAVVCYHERKVEVYYLEKKNKIDSERIFMLNWIFKKLEQEDEAELKLKKTQKEDSDKSLPKNEIACELYNELLITIFIADSNAILSFVYSSSSVINFVDE